MLPRTRMPLICPRAATLLLPHRPQPNRCRRPHHRCSQQQQHRRRHCHRSLFWAQRIGAGVTLNEMRRSWRANRSLVSALAASRASACPRSSTRSFDSFTSCKSTPFATSCRSIAPGARPSSWTASRHRRPFCPGRPPAAGSLPKPTPRGCAAPCCVAEPEPLWNRAGQQGNSPLLGRRRLANPTKLLQLSMMVSSKQNRKPCRQTMMLLTDRLARRSVAAPAGSASTTNVSANAKVFASRNCIRHRMRLASSAPTAVWLSVRPISSVTPIVRSRTEHAIGDSIRPTGGPTSSWPVVRRSRPPTTSYSDSWTSSRIDSLRLPPLWPLKGNCTRYYYPLNRTQTLERASCLTANESLLFLSPIIFPHKKKKENSFF